MVELINNDCLEAMRAMADNSVDAVVTDPPYGLVSIQKRFGKEGSAPAQYGNDGSFARLSKGFMGKEWDGNGIEYSVEMWSEVLRVLKPGGYLLSFGGTRTYHRMACAIEDAGFEIRDMVEWLYGSGFPKSLDIGKAIDKQGGENLGWFIDYILNVAEERGISRKELTALFPSRNGNLTGWLWNKQYTQGITIEQYNTIKDFLNLPFDTIKEAEREIIGKARWTEPVNGIMPDGRDKSERKILDITAPATEAAKQWNGWGTSLKPAHEPICMARKPLEAKTVAENVLKYGTGGINIDGCRIETNNKDKNIRINPTKSNGLNSCFGIGDVDYGRGPDTQGRFPANLIHDGSEEVVREFPNTKTGGSPANHPKDKYVNYGLFANGKMTNTGESNYANDFGSAARFFYCAKASKSERNQGCEGIESTMSVHGLHGKCAICGMTIKHNGSGVGCTCGVERIRTDIPHTGNYHPTVKPVALMRYLCKLVTPPGGIVLDPFMGSGTTGIAAKTESFSFIGIEKEKEYFDIAEARINKMQVIKQLTLL